MKLLPTLRTTIILIAAAAPACGGGELTRPTAEQLIRAANQYPKRIVGVSFIKRGAGLDPRYSAYVDRYRAHFDSLQAQGLATYTSHTATERDGSSVINFVGVFTPKGQALVVGPADNTDRNPDSEFVTVITAHLEFGEITGIVERSPTQCEVQYTEKTVATPFGTIFGVSQTPVPRTATFTKYDDGWRLN